MPSEMLQIFNGWTENKFIQNVPFFILKVGLKKKLNVAFFTGSSIFQQEMLYFWWNEPTVSSIFHWIELDLRWKECSISSIFPEYVAIFLKETVEM